MYLKQVFFSVIVFLHLAVIAAADEPSVKVKIAIMDFTGDDVPFEQVLTITNILYDELKKRNNFTVIERNTLQDYFNDNHVDQLSCNTGCALKAGKTVSAQKVITGIVKKSGDALLITVSVYDVETGLREFISMEKPEIPGTADALKRIFDLYAKSIKHERTVAVPIDAKKALTGFYFLPGLSILFSLQGPVLGMTPLEFGYSHAFSKNFFLYGGIMLGGGGFSWVIPIPVTVQLKVGIKAGGQVGKLYPYFFLSVSPGIDITGLISGMSQAVPFVLTPETGAGFHILVTDTFSVFIEGRYSPRLVWGVQTPGCDDFCYKHSIGLTVGITFRGVTKK